MDERDKSGDSADDPGDRFSTDFYSKYPHLYAVYMSEGNALLVSHFALTRCEEWGLQPTRRGLSYGCGPAVYSIDLAQLGIEMVAMDLSPGMLEHARARAQNAGVEVEFHEGNMLDWVIDDPVDFALNLGENLSYLLEAHEMLQHLRTAARSIRAGGLYICQLSSPLVHWSQNAQRVVARPPWIVFSGLKPMQTEDLVEGHRVSIRFNGDTVLYDPIRQVFRSEIAIAVGEGEQREEFSKVEQHRAYFPQEFMALVALDGSFELLGLYFDYHVDAPLANNPEAAAFIAVMRRTEREVER
ncbi:MAG: class I SAM-dependent methyltransferase [Myxococcales bacterium]|nr:class I SAM-dependent methyltransferase [Myxococcales bacterium]